MQCFGTGPQGLRGRLGVFALFRTCCSVLRSITLEPARANRTLRLHDHHALSPSARARSSQLHFEASRPQCSRPIRSSPLEPIALRSFKATVLEANPLEPARANCTLKLQGHNARSQSARALRLFPSELARAECSLKLPVHHAPSPLQPNAV